MYILANMWFTKLIKQFFFWIDKMVYNFIPTIYDLLVDIASTSILTQADIADMANRIYKLLAIFMIFKVTLSLITYVVNPDDFSDKSKGVSKLGTNIVISLAMLILTPYIFNYAYQLQTIILEDNSLATLIFGGSTEEDRSFFNTAGDDMAYITMSAFLSPNLSWGELHECSSLIVADTGKINQACKDALTEHTKGNNPNFTQETLTNYIAGVENNNLGLMLRQDLVLATSEIEKESDFIMDYKFIFSTVVGVIIILILVTFCMDIALRSIKLSFFQLIAPIPILSYVDPKSGKDGLFKKWYEMCFKTYLSLFVRLIALYFAVYIISKVADRRLVNIIDGSYQTNIFIKIFIIIGALMFAKQLPKILEGLGIKLDGGGKFFLNPFKKLGEEAIGGKRITGAAGGAVAGLIGNKGNPFAAAAGALRGFTGGKGYAGGLAAQADVNRKMRDLRIGGARGVGAAFGAMASRYGLDDANLERRATRLRKNEENFTKASLKVDQDVKSMEAEKKRIQDSNEPKNERKTRHKRMQDIVSSMEKRAKDEIELGHGGDIGKEYLTRKARAEYYENNIGHEVDIDGKKVKITPEMAGQARQAASDYLTDQGMKEYMTQAIAGSFKDGGKDTGKGDLTFTSQYGKYKEAIHQMGEHMDVLTEGDKIHAQYGQSKGEVAAIEASLMEAEDKIRAIDGNIRKTQATTMVKIDGKDVSYEDAKNIIETERKKLDEDKKQSKQNREFGQIRSIINSKK